MRYIGTFYTHLAALKSARALGREGHIARLMPVPRKLSASCGTCVSYEAEEPCLQLLDADMEAVYRVLGEDDYRLEKRGENE